MIAGAGPVVFLRKFRDTLKRRLTAAMTTAEIIDAADSVLYPQLHKYLQIKTEVDCLPEILVGIRTAEGLSIFENQRGHEFAAVDGAAQCIGFGKYLAQYLVDWLFHDQLFVHWARGIAAFMLKQTKKKIPECGGESHIWIVPGTKDFRTIPPMTPPFQINQKDIAELERQFDVIETAMRKVLIFAPAIEGVEARPETLKMRMDALAQAASAALVHRVSPDEYRALLDQAMPSHEPAEGEYDEIDEEITPSISETANSASSPIAEASAQKGPRRDGD